MLATVIDDFSAVFCLAKPVYILIDPLLGEPVPLDELESLSTPADLQAAREKAWSRDIHMIALDQKIELPAHLHPYLVAMHEEDGWLKDTLNIAQQERLGSQVQGLAGNGTSAHRIGGWLQSSLAGDDLARRLSKLLLLEKKPGVDARYLRMADRRVLAWLRHVVGDTRLQWTLAFVDCWAYLDTCGQLTLLKGHNKPLPPPRIWFVNDQWERLLQGDKHHRTAARWLGEADTVDHSLENAGQTLWPTITCALNLAEQARHRAPEHFVTDDDLIAWAVLVLLHPQLQQLEHPQNLLKVLGNASNEPVHQRCMAMHSRLLKGTDHERQ